MPLPIEARADGVLVMLKVTPRASANRVRDVAVDANGVARLQVSVTAVPEDGKANAAVIKLLSRALGVTKSALSVITGATDRRKTVLIAGNPEALSSQLGARLRLDDGLTGEKQNDR